MEATACVKCGGPIAEAATTGRPKKYCSPACRRSAEHEIRRVNVLLGKLEEKVSNARLGYGYSGPGSVDKLEGEIARHEARLRALLGGTEDE
jgi:hypothetical protein